MLCAVIVRAVVDAERGNTEARAWLETTGRAWCALLGLEVADWKTAGSRLRALPGQVRGRHRGRDTDAAREYRRRAYAEKRKKRA